VSIIGDAGCGMQASKHGFMFTKGGTDIDHDLTPKLVISASTAFVSIPSTRMGIKNAVLFSIALLACTLQ